MIEQIEENPNIPVTVVQEQFQRRYSIGVSKMKAYREKTKAKKQVEGDYISQYALLRDYILELKDKNPGSTVRLEVEPPCDHRETTRKFKRIYVCLGALKQGFKAIGRDLLGLDGAFMKGPFPGQILIAVCIDPNNGIYPVCYAIVEAENINSWTWFLQLLGDDLDLHRNSNFTFVSDRQKGILQVVNKLYPNAEHRYCLRHIHENMKVTFRGNLYKDMLWKYACGTTVPEFQIAMDELKAFNKEAHLWLSKIPPLHWSRSYFSGRAISDVLLNNMCEVYNGKILDGREKPIISALEYIREYLMRRIITVLKWNGGDIFSVSGKPNYARVVDLAKRTCACRAWEIIGMPCKHVVATIWNMATNGRRVGSLESWSNPIYTMARWKQVYDFKVNPINERSLSVKCQVPTTLSPPNHHKQVGRPKKARKRSALEMEDVTKSGRLTKKHTKGKCGKCGHVGQNTRTCKGDGTV
ncbi:uncharacterized protein LOC110931216 [Helianthus annuus]|uniref:uncharacterized protein LOC110931216 n=1 Tax=Helianthus annuus TaxID=4232 RepID=UPI000B8F5C59|nr:uncharacterized protein LOC110931216 [Helianthus annuus]